MKTTIVILFFLVAVCAAYACPNPGKGEIRGYSLYTQVSDSIQKWHNLPSGDFGKLLKEKKVQLVDVRTKGEYDEGHIPGAKNMDVRGPDFGQDMKKLDKKKPVAVYCKSGMRSKMAAEKLIQEGFTVYNLEKGFLSWDGEVEK